jgi:hypothetical protein
MPSGSRIDALSSALTASKPSARVRDENRLCQTVHVHVGLVLAGLTRGDDGANAIFAHVR